MKQQSSQLKINQQELLRQDLQRISLCQIRNTNNLSILQSITDINQLQYVIVDIQTTGLEKQVHKIIEIAAILYENGGIKDKYHTLVHPQTHISQKSSSLTGIDNQMIKQAPKIYQVLPAFMDFLGDNIFVAHNAEFDYDFIDYNCEKYLKRNLSNPKLCTKRLAFKLLPGLQSKTLSQLCRYYKIGNQKFHRAMNDVQVTIKILEKFIMMLAQENITEKKDIIKLSNMHIHYQRKTNYGKNKL